MNQTNQQSSYIELIKHCVFNTKNLDESLVKYILDFNPSIRNDLCFIDQERYITVKTDIWGYINIHTTTEEKELWSKLLNKTQDDPRTYQVKKIGYHNYDKKPPFKPGYFLNEYTTVSENFLALISFGKVKVKINELTTNDKKAFINEFLTDDTLYYTIDRLPEEDKEFFIHEMKKFLIENFQDLSDYAKKEKKHVLRMIAQGDYNINNIFSSLNREELCALVQQYNLEDKLLTYMRYKDISKSYFIYLLNNYKDKDFWLKELNCYDKKTGEFDALSAISEIIRVYRDLTTIDPTKIHSETKTENFFERVDTNYSNVHNRIMEVLDYFSEDLKQSPNYKKEMEKLFILSLLMKNKEFYLNLKELAFENKIEISEFKTPVFKQTLKISEKFLESIKKEEIKRLERKLQENLKENTNKTPKLKI